MALTAKPRGSPITAVVAAVVAAVVTAVVAAVVTAVVTAVIAKRAVTATTFHVPGIMAIPASAETAPRCQPVVVLPARPR